MERRKSGSITTPFTKDERIISLKEDIRICDVLISYYTDLINPDSNCSFQVYLKELDAKAEIIKAERRGLIARYDKATNGEIPSLQKQQEELQERLKKLRATMTTTPQRIKKAKDLRCRIEELEQQIRDENFDVEELLDLL